jgi:hypothetical protein
MSVKCCGLISLCIGCCIPMLDIIICVQVKEIMFLYIGWQTLDELFYYLKIISKYFCAFGFKVQEE